MKFWVVFLSMKIRQAIQRAYDALNYITNVNNGAILTDRYYLVFPSWSLYKFKWDKLARLFVSPANYGLGSETAELAALGYTVNENDHEFADGPNGGGIIIVKRDTRRWFPATLLRRECSFENPPGFPHFQDYRCFVLVPKIMPEHKLGVLPVPPAPSPLFSVEPISGGSLNCQIALGFASEVAAKNVTLPKTFASLGLEIERRDIAPDAAQHTFLKIKNRRLIYYWYVVNHREIEVRAWMAAIIYLGLWLAHQHAGSLRVLHIFSSSFIPGVEYPSASKWTGNSKTIRTAYDW